VQVLRWQDSELLSNINMAYNVPTYAGVDSDVKKKYRRVSELPLTASPSKSLHRGGLFGTLTIRNCFDILGAKYDWDGHDLVTRPKRPVPTVLVSSTSKSVADRKEMLARLTQPDFDPSHSIMLDAQPPQAAWQAKRFRAVGLRIARLRPPQHADQSETTGVLLFNDSYSRYWECTCNGEALPVNDRPMATLWPWRCPRALARSRGNFAPFPCCGCSG